MTTASNSDARKRLAARDASPDTTGLREVWCCGAPDCGERITCPRIGGVGHWQCGMCDEHDLPRHRCGCLAMAPEPDATVSDPVALTDAEGVAFDWHDATCPEGADCRDRFLHATCGGGAVLPIVERIVAARVAEAVEQERAARLALVAKIESIHRDGGPSQGYFGTEYTERDHCCTECGSHGEYGIEWPCATVRALLDDTRATS